MLIENGNIDSIIFIGFEALIIIILTSITFHALIHIFCKQNDNHNNNNNILYHSLIQSIQYATIFALLSYNLSIIFILIWDIMTIFPPSNTNTNPIIFGDIGIALDCLGRILFQITFIFRLQTCFHGTSMQFSKCSTNSLYIATISLIIPGIGLLIDPLRWYSSILWLLLDCIISLRMSWLFLHKLYKVMLKSTINTLPSSRIDVDKYLHSHHHRNNDEMDNETDKPSMLSVDDTVNTLNNEENENENETKHDIENVSQQIEEEEVTNIEINDEVQVDLEITEQEQEQDPSSKPPSPSQQDKQSDEEVVGGDVIMTNVTNNNMNTTNIDRENLERLISRDYLKEYDLITLMTKYSLLVTISYSSSLLSVIIIFILRKDVELVSYSHAKYIEHLLISIAILINMLCLYLSYAFNNNHYYFCCKFGHKLFNNCCIKCISDKMRNDTEQLL